MVARTNGGGNAAAATAELPIEGEILPALGALEQQTRGEIDVQITTAKRFPRSIKTFIEEATSMATLDEEIAAACIYAKPQDGSVVEGPSARLAEICASAWGNMRIEARQVAEDDRFVTARGTSWDLQRNVAIAFEVKRRITKRGGAKYGDDMIGTTSNAAASIALRNAVFKNIPAALWRPIYQKCREVAVGKASTLASTRSKMVEYFQKLGVVPARLFALFQVKGIEDISLEHVAVLRGLATSIKEGEVTVDEAFPVNGGSGQSETDQATLLTIVMSETGADQETAKQILARFDELQLKPADRLVRLKAHKGRAADLLRAMAPAAADDASVGPAVQVDGTQTAAPTVAQSTQSSAKPPAESMTASDVKWNF